MLMRRALFFLIANRLDRFIWIIFNSKIYEDLYMLRAAEKFFYIIHYRLVFFIILKKYYHFILISEVRDFRLIRCFMSLGRQLFDIFGRIFIIFSGELLFISKFCKSVYLLLICGSYKIRRM